MVVFFYLTGPPIPYKQRGKRTRRSATIDPFAIPTRSPDFNICDYALWKEVNKSMRLQEKKRVANAKQAISYSPNTSQAAWKEDATIGDDRPIRDPDAQPRIQYLRLRFSEGGEQAYAPAGEGMARL
jgi:hypothetical protein